MSCDGEDAVKSTTMSEMGGNVNLGRSASNEDGMYPNGKADSDSLTCWLLRLLSRSL
jgi:hypothetical protein